MRRAQRPPPSLLACLSPLAVFSLGMFGTPWSKNIDIVSDETTRYDTGTISGILAMKYWRKTFSTGYINPTDDYPDVTSTQSSMIVSLLSAGTFFGALASAPVADYFGRRIAMIIESFVFCFGVVLQTAATSIPLFVAGRFFAGFGVGLLSATSKPIELCSTRDTC